MFAAVRETGNKPIFPKNFNFFKNPEANIGQRPSE
jgi:hypothetical protein